MTAPLTPEPTSAAPAVPRRGFLAKVLAAVAGGALLARVPKAAAATDSASPFLGEIMLFAGNFNPVGWLPCDGRLMPINQNTALFSLLGTQYGGDGRVTFALPDLRGRVPVGSGGGPGLTPRNVGDVGGEENHTLLISEMPSHSHTAYGDAANGTSEAPGGLNPARNPAGVPQYGSGTGAVLAPAHIGLAGNNVPHNNMPPYLALTYCIAIAGIFPSRS